MTDNQLKIELLKLAIDVARETMFAKRTVIENRWQTRTAEEPFPDVPGIDHKEIVKVYNTLMKAVG